MSRPPGLGRGLQALIPAAAPGHSGLATLRLSSIRPNRRQPRGSFDQQALEELAHSLREVGLLQPIVVRPLDDGRYEIVAGERRYRAAKLAGLDELPAVVRHTGDDQLLTEALVENLHRTDLNPLEEAAAYQQLLDDFALTHEGLAQRLGKSRSSISNALRLLSLPVHVQHRLADGRLSAGHARALAALDDPSNQARAADRVLEEGLSVRATEELVRGIGERPTAQATMSELGADARRRRKLPYAALAQRLGDALATRVKIAGSERRGRVVIDYSGPADLERLLGILGRGTGQDLLRERP